MFSFTFSNYDNIYIQVMVACVMGEPRDPTSIESFDFFISLLLFFQANRVAN